MATRGRYDILPRHNWLRESAICQSPDEFVLDPISQTQCCPAPDYCCPNSVVDCTDPRAVLYDATRVPEGVIANGWRQHFVGGTPSLARAAPVKGDLSSAVCPASEWNGGLRGKAGCSPLAMTDESVERVQRVWREAPAWLGPRGETVPIDDDNIG